MFNRIVVSAFLRTNAELYQFFLTEHPSIEQFCRSEVDPMWRDADQLQIVALTNFWRFKVNIVKMKF